MITPLVITYLCLWIVATLCGLALSFTSLVPGFSHEYRTAAGLNGVLFCLTLAVLFSTICKTERVLRMMIWLLHFEFLAPVIAIWIYSLQTVGNNSAVFYYFITFIAVPVIFFCCITGVSVGNFIFE